MLNILNKEDKKSMTFILGMCSLTTKVSTIPTVEVASKGNIALV